VWRGSVGASIIQIMLITSNLLCNTHFANAFDWIKAPLLVWTVSARRGDSDLKIVNFGIKIEWTTRIYGPLAYPIRYSKIRDGESESGRLGLPLLA
jgi:hypothetical protein